MSIESIDHLASFFGKMVVFADDPPVVSPWAGREHYRTVLLMHHGRTMRRIQDQSIAQVIQGDGGAGRLVIVAGGFAFGQPRVAEFLG